MKTFCFKNAYHLACFELKVTKKQIVAWSVAMFGIMFLYMILFSSMQEMAQVKMEAMPEELLQFVGMEDFSSLSNYIAYFGMIFNLVLIAMSIFATTYASGIISKEEKTKSIEFLTSLHVSRLEIYASKVLASFVALLAVIASTMVSAMLCGFLNGGETFVLMDLIAIIKISSMSAFVFMAVGLCLGGVSGKLGTSAIGSMVVVVSYVLGYLSVLLDGKATWLQYASPFEVLSPSNALAMSSHTLIGAMVYCFLMVALVIIGGMRYQKRDFVI